MSRHTLPTEPTTLDQLLSPHLQLQESRLRVTSCVTERVRRLARMFSRFMQLRRRRGGVFRRVR